jgi:hydroxymethylglutaryl-CoA synthase
MTLPVHQDAVVFGMPKLIVDHNIDLTDILEFMLELSAIDSSKPISSFLVALMDKNLDKYLASCCRFYFCLHCRRRYKTS